MTSVQWEMTSVHAGDSISTVGDNISTVEGIQYCGGISSVLWGDNSSTCGGIVQYWGKFSTVGDNISTVGDSFSTVEGIQYIGGITLVHAGDNISTVGDNISTVEGI